MWDLIVSVPDHCLSFYFRYFSEVHGWRSRWALGSYFEIGTIPRLSDYHMHQCLIQISHLVTDDLKVVPMLRDFLILGNRPDGGQSV